MNKIIKIALCIVISTTMIGCKKDVKTIISDTKAASFVIYTFDEYGSPSGSGSGFFIDSKGTGITNYHVLDGAVKAILKMSDSTEVEIDKVLASDEKWDIVYSKGELFYGNLIEKTKRYDKPLPLSGFQKMCNHKNDCCTCKRWSRKQLDCIAGITSPPQSWCYVEDLKGESE